MRSPKIKAKVYPPKHLGIIPSHADNNTELQKERIKESSKIRQRKDVLKRRNTMPNDPMPTLCYGNPAMQCKLSMKSVEIR